MMSLLRDAASPGQYCAPTLCERNERRSSRATIWWLARSRYPRRAVLGPGRGVGRRTSRAALDFLTSFRPSQPAGSPQVGALDARRVRALQTVGMLCGLTAAAWLGAA